MSDVSNLKDTIIPKSDQLSSEQLLSGPITITVSSVTRGAAEQPVIVSYDGDAGRPYKPCKTMRKLLLFAWGDDGREWVGKSMTLYCDPEVKFGGVKVGGIRISHMSHIESDIAVSLTATKGKKELHRIKKLPQIDRNVNVNAVIESILAATTMESLDSAIKPAVQWSGETRERAKDAYRKCKARIVASAPPQTSPIVVTAASLMERMRAAPDVDSLGEVADLIGEIADAAQRAELDAAYRLRLTALTGG